MPFPQINPASFELKSGSRFGLPSDVVPTVSEPTKKGESSLNWLTVHEDTEAKLIRRTKYLMMEKCIIYFSGVHWRFISLSA